MWWFTFLKSLMEYTSLWVGTNQQSRQSGSSPLNTDVKEKVEIFITLVSEFNQHLSISAVFSTFKHIFLFIKNFLLQLELSVIIHTHSALAVFERFSEDSLTHKYLSDILLNNIFCTAERILHLFNINAPDSKPSMAINCSFRSLNLANINLLMNLSANLKLQRKHSFQHAVK